MNGKQTTQDVGVRHSANPLRRSAYPAATVCCASFATPATVATTLSSPGADSTFADWFACAGAADDSPVTCAMLRRVCGLGNPADAQPE